METLENILRAKRYLNTYAIGLLQTKAYRLLKQKTNLALKPFDIGNVDWAFLGVLYEEKKGMRLSSLAEALDVDAPFVTEIGSNLHKKNLVLYTKDETDARAKYITLTKEGRIFVQKVEKILRSEAKGWIAGVGVKDVLVYIKVLEAIVRKDSK